MGHKKTIAFCCIFSAFLIGLALHGHRALAFDPNNLMDDGVFQDSTSMSPIQIDIFLNGFAGSCISQNNGFVTDDPQGWNGSLGRYTFGAKVSAGQSIFDTAQLYHVNPQVILSTLQKEQSLVTGGSTGCHANSPDPATATPMTDQCGTGTRNCTSACPFSFGGGCMNIAMGYGCPNYCNVADEGFSMQLTLGTWLLRFGEQRAYGNLTGYTGYETGDENFCYSGPMTPGVRKRSAVNGNGCTNTPINYDGTYTTQDGVSVTIANGSTAALYNFTPFQSGNSKFVNIFQGWFGSPYQLLTWSLVSQYAYTDASRQTQVDLGKLGPGQRYYIGFVVQNTGNVTWLRSDAKPTRVGTTNPRDRASYFCDTSWLGCNRPGPLHEYSVGPGQLGSFEFWITTPTAPGSYNEIFAPMVEGVAWMDNHTVSFPMIVSPASYSWTTVSRNIFTDSSKSATIDVSSLVAGQRYYLSSSVRNTGNVAWQKGGSTPTVLGTSGPIDRTSAVCDPSWLGCNRPAPLREYSVAQGQIGSFEFWFRAPASGGYNESFTPLVEGVSWMGGLPINFAGTTTPAFYSWLLINQYAYIDSTKQTVKNMGQLTAGQRYYIGLTLKNTGDTIWHKISPTPFALGTFNPEDQQGKFCDSSWLSGVPGCNRPASLNEYTVAPGQIGSIEFWITAPSIGSYNEIYAPLVEGITWMDRTVSFPAVVH